jgi:membrane associated rhomboid family serine protease
VPLAIQPVDSMGLYDRAYYHDDAPLDLRPSWDQRSAVTVLIFVNVAVFLANLLFGRPSISSQGAINNLFILRSEDTGQPWFWWHTLSYAFAHDARSITHILFNMLSLYFLGRPVEQRYGRLEFYRIYLLAAFFGGALWLLRYAILGGEASVLGASGAVLCISMLFVFNYPNATVYLFIFPLPAWVLGVFFVLSNFFMPNGDGIAYDVHLFGIAFAAMYFFLGWNFSWMESPRIAWSRVWRRISGPRLKLHRDRALETEQRDALEADRILAKIHESGKDSLSSKEKRFLERYSQAVRNKKKLDLD